MPNRNDPPVSRTDAVGAIAPATEATVSMLEEASACPICKHPGRVVSSSHKRVPSGKLATIDVYNCENERCRWFGTGWVVQLNDDGSIPKRNPNKKGGDREFDEMSPAFKASAQSQIDEMRYLMNQDLDNVPRGDRKSVV